MAYTIYIPATAAGGLCPDPGKPGVGYHIWYDPSDSSLAICADTIPPFTSGPYPNATATQQQVLQSSFPEMRFAQSALDTYFPGAKSKCCPAPGGPVVSPTPSSPVVTPAPTDPTDPTQAYPCTSGADQPCVPGQAEFSECCSKLSNCGAVYDSVIASLRGQAQACIANAAGNVDTLRACIYRIAAPVISSGQSACDAIAKAIGDSLQTAIATAAELAGTLGVAAQQAPPATGWRLWVGAPQGTQRCYVAPDGSVPMDPGDQTLEHIWPDQASAYNDAAGAGCAMVEYAPPASMGAGGATGVPGTTPISTFTATQPAVSPSPATSVVVGGVQAAAPGSVIQVGEFSEPTAQPPGGALAPVEVTLVNPANFSRTIQLPPEFPVSDYCEMMARLKGKFIALGKWVVSGTVVSGEVASFVAGAVTTMPEGGIDRVKTVLDHLRGDKVFVEFWSGINGTLSGYPLPDVDAVTYLLAAKSFIDFVASLKVGYGRTIDTGGEVRTALGLEVFHLGGGGVFTETLGNTLHITGDLHLAFVNLTHALELLINSSAPQEIPSIQDAIEMYLANQISDGYCKCLVELRGGVWSEWQYVIQARRERPNADQILGLYLRKQLTQEEAIQRLRGLGFINEGELQALFALTDEIPGVQDIVRFMVRNVYDAGIVAAFDLDAEFGQKYAGQLEQWGQAQGIGPELAKAFWRAHWVVPSPGQLYTMLQRLRTDNVPAGVNPADWIVSPQDLNRALGENDILPFWRKRLEAVAYNPLTRIDARRMRLSGALTRDEFISSTRDIGYTLENASKIADWIDKQLLAKLQGNKDVKRYAKGQINGTELTAKLRKEGLTDQEIGVVADLAKQEMALNLRASCVAGVKKQFLAGGLTEQQTIPLLTGYGLDLQQANTLLAGWDCERQSRGKEVNAGALCKYAERGLIDATDYYSRLRRLGYADVDAKLIVIECQARITERQAKALESASKVQQAALAKQTALAEKLRKQQASMEAKQLSAAAKLAKEQRALDRRLNKSAHKYAKVQKLDIDTVDTEYRQAIEQLSAKHRVAYGIAAEMVIRAGDNYAKSSTESLAAMAEREYQGLQTVAPVEGIGNAVS